MINELILNNFEHKYGVSLPNDYKHFLIVENGKKMPINSYLHLKDIESDVYIDLIFGIGKKECWEDLDYWMSEYADELPENSIIIGSDISGGFIVNVQTDEGNGIYYWDSSFQYEQSSESSNAYFICNSFKDLMSIIKHG